MKPTKCDQMLIVSLCSQNQLRKCERRSDSQIKHCNFSRVPFETGRVRQPPPVADGDGLLPDVDRSVVVLEQPPRVVLIPGHLVELRVAEFKTWILRKLSLTHCLI